MANKNDFNYYKNEYGKYKANYYSPGSEEYKKRQSGSRKQKAAKIMRAFLVFVIIAAVVVGIVFGIIKLTSAINTGSNKETTTKPVTETTTVAEDEGSKFKKGTECIVKTEEGTGVNLRSKPTYDVSGYRLIADGETVVIAEISEDGKWCKTSNFDKDGWLNLKYLQIVDKEEENTTDKKEEEETTEKLTEKETTTEKPETTTEGKTELDGSITSYDDAVKAFKEKGNGTVMNCKIVGSGNVFATYSPDPTSARILLLVPGEQIKVVAVDGNYSKVVKVGFESSSTWVPNKNLSFVSWG